MSQSDWLSAYLYYAEPFEPLLTDFVNPFASRVLSSPEIEQFFFIRYWHRGPHIRLRFKVGNNEKKQELKKDLQERFTSYVDENPSKREEPDWVSSLEGDNKWQTNNSIQFVTYEPEIKRYGGEKAIQVAEHHFQQSSEAVLAILSSYDDWDYERALGTAIQLHLSFAHAMDMSTLDAKHFFEFTFFSWFPRAIRANVSKLSEDELSKVKKETMEAFEKGFQNQKEFLVPFCENFWRSLSNGEQVSPETDKWIDGVGRTAQQISNIQKQNDLDELTKFTPREDIDVPVQDQKRWHIYQSYVHMTNNRLGIRNRDEGFLGFLIRESFKVMAGN